MNYLEFISTAAISLFITLITYMVIYSLKPNLKILKPELDGTKIHIKIVNEGRFSAVNIRIEVCAYKEDSKKTSHFDTDHKDFLIIPAKKKNTDNTRVFKTIGLLANSENKYENYDKLIEKLKNKEYKLRVRIHSYHGFSGLGKAEESVTDL